MAETVWALLFLLIPIGIIYGCRKIAFLEKIGSIVIAYIIGIAIGNANILPSGIHSIQETFVAATILIAIPLLLFSSNIKTWIRMAPNAILSMALALVSIILIAASGYLIFYTSDTENLNKIAGMLVGVYSGGTPNLASLKLMLGVDDTTYILVHTYDMLFSSIYLFFLMSLGYKFFRLFLKPSKNKEKIAEPETKNDPYIEMFRKDSFGKLMLGMGLAIILFAIGAGLSMLIPESSQMAVVILSITTLGIGASSIKKIREIKYTFDLGMYFILVFSLVVASMADLSKMAEISGSLFMFVAFAIFGSLTLHAMLSKLFNIDADIMMITSTALICSPPFVPVIAASIKNRGIILSGLTIGIIGYAIGNYLGFIIANLLSYF
jgi:uncharacterized membrane protein